MCFYNSKNIKRIEIQKLLIYSEKKWDTLEKIRTIFSEI